MRIIKDNFTILKSNKIKIAYSICGVGHGHYGRNIEIINSLSKILPNCEITLYLNGDTWKIFSMDRNLPENVKIKKIPGFKFIYKKAGTINSMGSTFTDLENWSVFINILKMDFLHTTIFPFKKLNYKLNKIKDGHLNRYFMKYFDDFDFAISDLEILLPRIADVTKKPFITLDNQHIMLYGDINMKDFTFKEKLEHFFIKNVLAIYHPISDLSILTCFHKIPIKRNYEKYVKEVGPVIRNNIAQLKDKIEYKNYILVYAHEVLGYKLFPILTEIKDQNFVVFTPVDFNNKDFKYKRDWIKYFPIDPINFLDYIVKCKAVISTAGNTLISESVYLQKPFFAVSLEGNFEQRLNLHMLEKSGWGEGCQIPKFTKRHLVKYINNIEHYQHKLQKSNIQNNTDKIVKMILDKINEKVIIEN